MKYPGSSTSSSDQLKVKKSARFKLATLLSVSIAGITVIITLITAFTMFKVYDDRLIIEFQDGVISESEEYSRKITTALQDISQQLKLFALDNSIRVTLMLNVDYQLQERMATYDEKHQDVINFIVKNNGEIIVAENKPAFIEQVRYFTKQNITNGQVFLTGDGKFYVGYTTDIISREKQLGRAGILYKFNPQKFMHPRTQQQGASFLYSTSSHSLLNMETGSESNIRHQAVYQRGLIEFQEVINNHVHGYLLPLHGLPRIHYFMPSTELTDARQDGITRAILLSLIAAMLATIVAIWLSRYISRPLNSLVLAANQIANGGSDQNQLPRQSQIAELNEFSYALIKIVQTLKSDEKKILRQANFDSLTGLPNRNLFMDRINNAIRHARRKNSSIALMFIDLDQFKFVNDTLGHAAGDLLLKQASQRLLDKVESSDTVARLGGDEFTVLMPNITDLNYVEDVVENILQVLSATFQLEDNEAYVSASIGITIYPDDGKEVGQLLSNADSAMYRAKEKGRNNAQFFTIQMNEHANRRRTLEVALRQAIDKNELELHYQPIYKTSNKQIIGAEALLRWKLNGNKFISPVEFIPLAEDTGLILPIGEWIIKTACQAAQNWNQQHHFPLRIAVNLSSRQFQRADIPLLVDEALTASGLDPSLLTLEITESLLLSDNNKTMDTMNKLRKMGIEIAIDDFGTGYSSLSYLKRFPVTTLKIDRSFIDELPQNQEDAALVEAILSMSQSLNLKLVAEGVETDQQYQFLKERNCGMIQGFYLSKPLKNEDFEKYLSNIPRIIASQSNQL